ncbi:MAG: YqeG family HAD IIIA-type phosphatase [Vulcanimicrobiota bacterium]
MKEVNLEIYRPDLYYSGFCRIDFSLVKDKGIKNLIIDVDATIAHRDSDKPDIKAASIINELLELKTINRICLVSNIIMGKKREQRVAKIAEILGVPYVAANFFNRKPKPGPFNQGLKLIDASCENTAVIGDQLLTDIVGGNRLGMFTILVDPLGPPHWVTRLLQRHKKQAEIIKKLNLNTMD